MHNLYLLGWRNQQPPRMVCHKGNLNEDALTWADYACPGWATSACTLFFGGRGGGGGANRKCQVGVSGSTSGFTHLVVVCGRLWEGGGGEEEQRLPRLQGPT